MVPYVQERAELLPQVVTKKILQNKTDVLALQELWDDSHASAFKSALEGAGYTTVRPSARVPLFYGNGLLFAYPKNFSVVNEIEFIPFRRQSGIQKLTVHGMIAGTLRTAEQMAWHVITIHTQALSLKDKLPSDYDEILTMGVQISQLKETVAELIRKQDLPVVILGDFNFGPTLAPQFYKDLKALGFQPTNTQELITWSSQNLLVKKGLFPSDGDGQLDHILFYNLKSPVAARTRVEFNETYSYTPRKLKTCWTCANAKVISPLSDHFGLSASWE